MSEWRECAERCFRELGGAETHPGVFLWEGEPEAGIPGVRVVLQEHNEAVLEIEKIGVGYMYSDSTSDIVQLSNRVARIARLRTP